MSKKSAVSLVRQFSDSEIQTAVAAVALPVALQGVDVWAGSRDIGGNPAAHIAAVNGKSQVIGLCQCFGDFWFGSESRANLLKGITKTAVRNAFDAATIDVLRTNKPLESATMLEFLQNFVRASMTSVMVTPEKFAELEAKKAGTDAADKPEAGTDAADKPEAGTDAADKPETVASLTEKNRIQAELIEAKNRMIADLQAELAKAKESFSVIMSAKTLKEAKAALKTA